MEGPPPHAWLRSIPSILLGIAAALGVAELGLRPFRSSDGPPTPRIASDSFASDTLVRRQLDEGISVAHFSAAGARLTGNAAIPEAPTVVLLGDSYVVARAVSDRETMGSRVEQLARSTGRPLNVRQYGWSGASPSRYLIEADSVIRRWPASDIVIALSDNDLDANALNAALPRLRVTQANTVEVLPTSRLTPPGGPPRSVLVSMLEQRTWEFRSRLSRQARLVAMAPAEAAPPPPGDVLSDSAQLAMLPSAVVRSLAAAYGPRLAIVYLAGVRLSGDTAITPIEARLLATCHAESVRCLSTRDVMVAARDAGQIANGFFNTTPGNGHLNGVGHSLAGDVIWRVLQQLHAAPTLPSGQ